MDSLGDLLKKKAAQFDSDSTRGELALVQEELDRLFDGKVTAQKFSDKGEVQVTTSGSVLASELRLQQHSIIQNLNKVLKNELTRFYIRIQ